MVDGAMGAGGLPGGAAGAGGAATGGPLPAVDEREPSERQVDREVNVWLCPNGNVWLVGRAATEAGDGLRPAPAGFIKGCC